jgi:signal transduction histidine kinase/ligand-binding sensor domain-containing protein
MTRTRDGYMWLGTVDGAARFDGVRFTVFNPANTPEIRGTIIVAVFEDHAGVLWLATDNGGLARFADGRFTTVTTADGLVDDHPRALLEDRDGDLWIGTVGGLSRLRHGRFTNYTEKDGLPNPFVTSLAEDNEGNLWVATLGGLARVTDGRITSYTERDALPLGRIHAVRWDPAGQLWIGGDAGLVRWANGRFTWGARERLPEQPILSLCVDREGTLWVGTWDHGLLRRAGDRFVPYSSTNGLPGDRISAIYQDPDDDVWVGTSGGLVRFRLARFTVLTAEDGLVNDYPRSVYQDRTDAIWIASDDGLTRYRHGTFRTYTTRDGLPDNRIVALGEDRTGRLFVGSAQALMMVDGERFTRARLPASRANLGLRTVLADRSGGMWLGTSTLGAILQRGDQTRTYTRDTGLRDDFILTLFEDRAGAVWIGTLRGGASRIADGQVTTWTTDEGLGNNQVLSFYEDRDGAIWIGTHGGGLSRYKNGQLATIGVAEGLFNGVVFQILEDDSGNLWMSCNRGIFRASLNDLNDVADGKRPMLASVAYGVADGMLSSDCNQGSPGGYKMRDGTLWFPTARGVVVVDPAQREERPPRVNVERVTLDRLPVFAEQELRIPPGSRNLEIEYTGLSWSRPQQVTFRYQMAGLDADWVDAGRRRTAYFSYLPPGSYTFTVIADNGEGIWNTEGASLRVTVLPAFYQTRWFFGLVAALGLGSLAVAWKYRVTQLQRAQTAQQAFARQLIASQEAERKRIAAELHDGLGQHLVVIKNLALLTLNQAADDNERQQRIESISDGASQAIREVREISHNLRPYQLDRLGLTLALQGIVKTAAAGSPVVFTTDIENLDDAFTKEAEINLYRVVQESVNNIVKHAHATTASVTVRRQRQRLLVTIADDGRGFVATAPSGDPRQGGFGLLSISERVHLLGGTVRVESAAGRGTTVTIDIEPEAPAGGV